ncbi:unnamed protein product [Sphagnum tenellum]
MSTSEEPQTPIDSMEVEDDGSSDDKTTAKKKVLKVYDFPPRRTSPDDPTIKREAWTEEEDAILEEGTTSIAAGRRLNRLKENGDGSYSPRPSSTEPPMKKRCAVLMQTNTNITTTVVTPVYKSVVNAQQTEIDTSISLFSIDCLTLPGT